MPTIIKRFPAMAANFVVDNAVAGSQYEFAPFDGLVEIGILATQPGVQCAVFSGPDVLAEPGSAVPNSATEQTPKYPDDFFLEDNVAQGDRIKVTLTNASGAAATAIVAVRITPA